jgi:hypothetical protein
LNSLTEDGEITGDYLENLAETKLWDSFTYPCDHCNTDIKGLLAFIDHKKEAGINSYRVKCIEQNCNREFAALYSYINHCSGEHYKYLAFSCVFCNPTRIFYNMPCLLEHYITKHLDYNFCIFTCLECSIYCQSITQLRIHKMTTHDKVLSVSVDDSDSEPGHSSKKQAKLSDTEWTPLNASRCKSTFNIAAVRSLYSINSLEQDNSKLEQSHPGLKFHPKVRNVENRPTYPCPYEGCNRVLITQNGYDYHILTHTGMRQFNFKLNH